MMGVLVLVNASPSQWNLNPLPRIRPTTESRLFNFIRSPINRLLLPCVTLHSYLKSSPLQKFIDSPDFVFSGSMGRFLSLVSYLVAGLIGQSAAHFYLNYPPTIGFDDALEATPPCGSFTVDFSKDNVTNYHVGGDSLALTSIHPQATWLFRATLNQAAAGNWTDLLPAILQTGLGDYCERDIVVPASFAGSKGVIQVVQDAPDGILYQVRRRLHLDIAYWLLAL
jgi:hypothetical protein